MKKAILNKDDIQLIAIFAAIWAAFEILLGNSLHIMKIPFRGTILTFFSAIILIIANKFIGKRGALLLIASVTASLKAVSAGGFFIAPMIAIIMESLIAELIFYFSKSNLFSSIIAGIFIMLYTLTHGIIAQLFVFGIDIVNIYNFIAKELSGILGLNSANIYYFLSFLIVFYAFAGTIAGILGERIAIHTKEKIKYLSEK